MIQEKRMSTKSEDNKNSFAHFDRSFQEKIVQAFLTDRQWAARMAEIIDVNYFEFAYLRQMTDRYLAYYKSYKEFPSLELFITIMKDELKSTNDPALAEQIISVIKNTKVKKDYGDLQYVKDEALSFCRQRSFKNALLQCAELIKFEDQYDHAVEIIQKSIMAGQTYSRALSLEEDIDARYSVTFRKTIQTNICARNSNWNLIDGPSLDSKKILNGGVGSGELNVVIAPTGVGKSHFLTHVGGQALLQGKNVMHFTFELSERAVGVRYDSHLLGIDSLDCAEHMDEIKRFYAENAGILGKLRIKYFPTGSATVQTLRAFLDKLALENFRPDLLVIDYAQIMRSAEKYDLPRLELKKIFEELRAFAAELDLPIWTASQSNKEGAESDIIALANMSEAYAQAHICDFVVGLGRPESKKATGIGTLFVAKNRNGLDGMSFPIRIDTARSRFSLFSEEDSERVENEREIQNREERAFINNSFKRVMSKASSSGIQLNSSRLE
jgi:replicative DNA helicase